MFELTTQWIITAILGAVLTDVRMTLLDTFWPSSPTFFDGCLFLPAGYRVKLLSQICLLQS